MTNDVTRDGWNDRPPSVGEWGDRHPSVAHFQPLFDYSHLPAHLQAVSAPFAWLAQNLISVLRDGLELSAGLRKLVEAKDCCVRQAVIDSKEQG